MVDVDPEPDMVIVTPDTPEPFKVTRPEILKVVVVVFDDGVWKYSGAV